MSLESLQQQYNLLHNLLGNLEDQCQLWIQKQDITCAYASSIINLISQQNDAKSYLRKNNNDTIIKQGKKPYTQSYFSDFTSNGTNVVSFLPPLEFKSTYNNNIISTVSGNSTVSSSNTEQQKKSNVTTPTDNNDYTPAIINFLSQYPDVIEKLVVKQQYNIEQAIKNFKDEAEEFSLIKDSMVKIRHDAKNSVRIAYRKAIEMENQETGEEESMKEKVIDKMNTMEKAGIPLVDLEIWIDKIVTCYERECMVKEYLLKRLREGSLVEMTDWDNWNSRWNSQSYLDFNLEQDIREKIKAYKLLKIYEREQEKEI
ncbi:hypothetical protein PIROE2DRAFT_7375 [Piromyces sp. E2]|nr:hypothetical protein PIROE2DRAFT_7375 [Piromyces sp. E2]|eukprot:OUM65618.1 hypothetical protein PIROE2DRAFT_7375 [Piromyces sp. E2]